MKKQSLATALTVINLVLSCFLLSRLSPVNANPSPNSPTILKGTGLEIVDNTGKLRASITLMPVDSLHAKSASQGIVFRLIDTEGKPLIKMDATDKGGGMNICNSRDGYIQLLARSEGNHLLLKNENGKQQMIKP